MIVVSDSTPLIHMAKVERLDILFSLYKEIIVTKEVYREVVEEGLILEKDFRYSGIIHKISGWILILLERQWKN